MTIRRRAISPVIATVIIVAVAIAISIAVAGWLFGLWGGFAGGSPAIQVSSSKAIIEFDTGNNQKDFQLDVYVVNQGSGSDILIKVEITVEGSTVVLAQPNETIPANFSGWKTYQKFGIANTDPLFNIDPGDTLQAKLYFQDSGIVPIIVTVTEGVVGNSGAGS